MDRMPNDVLARVFSHLPTLDLGKILNVSRSWNILLSTSPKLWINVNVCSAWTGTKPLEKVFQILEVFSNRCQSTLETVVLPSSSLDDPDISKMIELLESSRATLRKLVFSPLNCNTPMIDLMDFVSRCPQLEELNLTGNDRGCEQVETSPGVLTHFFCYYLQIVPESQHTLLRHLKVLQVIEDGGPLLLKILSGCSNSLQHFTFSEGPFPKDLQDEFQEIVSSSLHQLKVLRMEDSDQIWSKEWDLSALQNLKELGINPEYHSSLGPFRTPIKLHLLISSYTEDREDDRLEILQAVINILDSSDIGALSLSLSTFREETANRSIDQVLEFLRVNIVLGAPCQNLKEFHLSKEFDFNATLLAEVLLSRRLLSKGYSILSPEGNEDDVYRCSELVLFLDQENQEAFKEAERKVLSRCSEWMREAAGKATLRTRSLSD